MNGSPIGLTELHLHLEGSMFPETAVELARSSSHPWAKETAASLRRRFRYGSFDEFLERIRSMCGLFRGPEVLERVARELSLFLGRFGVRHAEVYVSPYIHMKSGLEYFEVVEAVARGFEAAESRGGARSLILLDSVRHWGVDAASAVLDGAELHPHPRVVGFGLGGAEWPPLEEFVSTFERAAALGLRRVVHAGETGSGEDVIRAVRLLGVERIAHGIRAIESDEALGVLRETGIPLDLAVTSNYRTRVVTGTPHPIRRLIDEGVKVTLSTDDPSLFRTDPVGEYGRARRFGRLTRDELYAVARNGVEASFATEHDKDTLRRELGQREQEDEKP